MIGADELIMNDEDLYKTMLVAACLRVEDVWDRMSPYLCLEGDRYVNELDNPELFMFYITLRTIRGLSADEFSVPSKDMFMAVFQAQTCSFVGRDAEYLARIAAGVRKSSVEELYDQLSSMASDEELRTVVLDSCLKFLQNLRVIRKVSAASILGTGSMDAQKLIGELTASTSELNAGNDEEEDEFHHMGDEYAEDNVERIPLGHPFNGFNEALGGGLGKREHVIVAAPTGQGKTVFALQLAAYVASSGAKHVLFISTEQSPQELEPRIISCMSRTTGRQGSEIPFDVIKDGLDAAIEKNALSPVQIEEARRIQSALKDTLHMTHWKAGSRTVNDIIPLVRRAKERFGTIDLVVLDWIGAALAEQETDPSRKRNLYYYAAEMMKNLSLEENVAAVSLAQTSNDGFNKAIITQNELAECKTLHWQATAAFGISAMYDDAVNGKAGNEAARNLDGVQQTFRDNQTMNSFKSRKGKNIVFPIIRDFKFQRFSQL